MHGAIDPGKLFGLGLFDPQEQERRGAALAAGRGDRRARPRSRHDHGGHDHDHGHDDLDVNRHDERIRAFCITRDRPISWAALSGWLDALASMRGDDLLRVKAIVALADRPDQPVVLHGVQHLFHPPVLLPAWPDDDRRTRIVFITRDLPQR